MVLSGAYHLTATWHACLQDYVPIFGIFGGRFEELTP